MAGTDDEGKKGEDSPWKTAGIFGALGTEFVGSTIGGYFVGQLLDERFDTTPWFTLGCILLGLVVAGWHVILITRRFVARDEDEGR